MIRALPSDLWFEVQVTFVRLDHVPAVSDLPKGFLHPKTSQPHVSEELQLFRTLLPIDYQILFQINIILKTISQLKEKKVDEWKQTWQPRATTCESKSQIWADG